ncbi:glycosyltransferase family 2 protein [Saccharicrinis fermentans]|uniref:Chondroitin polymerase n=1 Tax=Saccharicrinis fermentans DSM 9555 = JCM 21142 TaxID=869213 RepID=W7YR71_9BACT|nr:glycosyltransferase family 2 protein [Saccharicrinis fermentans]GAF04944.1 chondroitin polymerase [Saccharicrinis fermentans DSM 9555 = JCM 21142]
MTTKSNFITIIVCTYNRADILKECLEALFNQTASQNSYEVLVVDNNSHDHTKQLVESFQLTHTNLRYYLEEKQGLSHARNAGYLNTKAEWIGYMDDDGKAHTDYIEKTFEVINNHDFDCFGGRYHAWYRTPKPKWLSSDFGTSPILNNTVGILKEEHNSGGIIFFRTDALKAVNGFSTKVGMSGNTIAYGEETMVQNEMRKLGFIIGYSPFIRMDHLVAEHKFKVSWHLKATYAHGRDGYTIWNSQPISFTFFLKQLIKNFSRGFTRNLYKFIGSKSYCIQNLIYDTMQPNLLLLGKYISQYSQSKHKV